MFPCPNGGCTKVFQYHSSLEKHLSLEKCTQSFERRTLLDHAKLGYKSRLEEGIGYTVSVTSAVRKEVPPGGFQVKKGWALKCVKKPYRFNEKQKAYLDAKVSIGQASGRKLDGDLVSRDMRRALGTDGTRLFKVSEYLTTQQCASYFSRLTSKVRHQMLDDFDVKASEEETNFSRLREAANSIVLQHPITYDHYDICAMVHKGSLKQLKLGMLQNICKQLELDVPPKPVRRKEVYVNLLDQAVASCTCTRSDHA